MIFFAGLMSFLQIFFLPALLIQSFFLRKQDHKNSLNLILLIPASLSINFILTCLLVLFRQNTSSSWWFIFISEILLISALSFFAKKKDFLPEDSSFRPPWPLVLISSIFIIIGFIHYVSSWGKVFTDWDAVVSWNRWALDFSQGFWPEMTLRYPQLVPSMISIPYLFMNEANIPFFSYANMNLIESLCYISLVIFSWKNKNSLPLILIILISYFPRKMMTIHSGGADMPLFYFSLITLCCLHTLYLNKKADWALLIGTFSALAAAETKQGGVLLALFFILCVWYLRRRFPLKSAIFIFSIIIATNVLEEYRISIGLSTPVDIVSVNPPDIFERLRVALMNIHNSLWLFRIPNGLAYCWQFFLLGLMIGGLILSKAARMFIIFALCFTPIWALMASYDTRNLAVALPFYIFAMGVPLQHFIFDKFLVFKSSRFPFSHPQISLKNYYYLLISVLMTFILVGLAGGLYFSNEKIKMKALQSLNKIGDSNLTRTLHEYFDKSPLQPNELIINHQYLYLPYIPRFAPYAEKLSPFTPLTEERVMQTGVRLLLVWYPRDAAKKVIHKLEERGDIKRLGAWADDNIFIFERKKH